MPTSECKLLLDACGPDIYSRNAFRLLGADVDMTGRQIKRRVKELQAAIEVDDLADEYSGALQPDPLPTQEELAQAGRVLADTQQRFIHEFFWLWPLEWGRCGSDKILKMIKRNQVKGALDLWQQIASANGNAASLIAKHNLAVLGHSLALDRERKILAATDGELTKEQRKKLNAWWDFAFYHWTPLCKNEAFWSMQGDRIRSLDDPRLTTGFVRRFSQSLPVAFDNINADMALAYCNRRVYARARDHVRIMKATNAGDDDVDTSLRRVTGPLNARIDHAIETATLQLVRDRRQGKQLCVELFQTVANILNVLKVLLGKQSQEYIETCDRVAESMLQCQVAYGNETEDWHGSIPVLESALKVARGAKARAHIEENLRTVRNNALADTCWFCGSRPKEEGHVVKVVLKKSIQWRDIKASPRQYRDVIQQIVASQLSLAALQEAFAQSLVQRPGDRLDATVRFLDAFLSDSTEVMSQQLTVTVPRCHICSTVHSRVPTETVGETQKKLRAISSTIAHEADAMASLGAEIASRSEALENAWFLRKWRLSSVLKSLRLKERQCKHRHARAKEEQIRLRSQLEQRISEEKVEAYKHSRAWPAVVEAINDGFHISG
jgi:hypothetical protein